MSNQQELSELLTAKMLAKMLHYSQNRIYAKADDGNFPRGIKIKGKRYWTIEEVNAYLEKTKAD